MPTLTNSLISSAFACLLAITSLGLPQVHAQATSLKTATVDMEKLFQGHYLTKIEAKKNKADYVKIEQENKARIAHLTKLKRELEIMKKQLEDPALSKSAKLERTRKFQEKLGEAKMLDGDRRRLSNSYTDQIERREQRVKERLLGTIRKRITEYFEGKDFDVVYHKSTSKSDENSSLLYIKGSQEPTDLTDVILAELNKDAPKP